MKSSNNHLNKGHKVNMISKFTKTPIQVEALFGEVSGEISPFWPASFDINLYGMKWQDGIYFIGLIDQAILLLTEDDSGMIEGIYCMLKGT
ncbi:20490_t:CDS:2 [Entrophospora sp. SA101]|nr:20490_t:CDS:2 [Entrophospora sp. SA101]